MVLDRRQLAILRGQMLNASESRECQLGFAELLVGGAHCLPNEGVSYIRQVVKGLLKMVKSLEALAHCEVA